MTGSMVGRFTVSAELGHGRLGRLYLGHDASGSAVCLRQLDPTLLARAEVRDAVVQLVRRLAGIHDPGVVGIVDLLEAGSTWYLVTAHVPGPTLRELADRAQVSRAGEFEGDAGSAMAILDDVGRACLALHAAGVAHGSVGPSAVLVGVDGHARLGDAALLSVLGGAPAQPSDDARGWAELARALRRAWVAARSAGDIDRLAEKADAGDLAGAVNGTGRERSSAARSALARAATAWEASRVAASNGTAPAAWVAATGSSSSTRPTILDGPGAGPVHGGTIIEAAPLSPPASTTPRGGTVIDAPPPWAPAQARGATVIEPPPPLPSPPPRGATVMETPSPAASAGGPPPALATSHGPTPYRLGATSPTPAALGATPLPAAPVHAGRPDGGSSSLLVSPAAAGDPPLAWPAARRSGRRRSASTPVIIGALVAVAMIVGAGVIVGLLGRGGGGLRVTAARLQVAQSSIPCNGSADITGIVDLSGDAGTVDYEWVLSDGGSTGGVRHAAVAAGDRQLDVQFRWLLSGPAGTRTVTLAVHGPQELAPARADLTYSCTR